MSWQTITKEKKLAISETILSHVLTVKRLDAEYFDPIYLERDRILNSKKNTPITDYVNISDGNHLSISEYFTDDGDIPYYRGQDLKSIFISATSPMKISREIYNRSWMKRSIFKPGDILLSIVGTIGNLSFVPDDLGEASGSCKIAILRPKQENFAKIGIAFLLCKYGQYQLKRMTRGAVQMGIILEDIPKIIVPMFSEEITSVINGIVSLSLEIEKVSRKNYSEAERLILEEINLAGYKATEENVSIRNLTDCMVDNHLDAEYWQPEYDNVQDRIKQHRDGYETLDNLFAMSDKRVLIEPEKEYLYVELADVNGPMGTIDNLTTLKGKDLPSRGRMSLKKDDVIVSSLDGSLSKIAIVSSDRNNIVGSTGFFVLRQKEYEPEVALVLLKSEPIQKLLKRQGQGTILTAIPKSSLSRVILPKLGKDVQIQIKELIIKSHKGAQEAKDLLEKAKRAVEIYIEEGEEKALSYIQ